MIEIWRLNPPTIRLLLNIVCSLTTQKPQILFITALCEENTPGERTKANVKCHAITSVCVLQINSFNHMQSYMHIIYFFIIVAHVIISFFQTREGNPKKDEDSINGRTDTMAYPSYTSKTPPTWVSLQCISRIMDTITTPTCITARAWRTCRDACRGRILVVRYWPTTYTHIIQDHFTGTGAIIRLPQCRWSNPEYEQKEHINSLGTHRIITTKQVIKIACIFYGMY